MLHSTGLKVSKDELVEIVKQRPNRKILPWTRFHLHMYNLPSDKRIRIARERKNQRRDKKDAKRISRGKDPKGPGKTKWEWLKEVVGEPPEIVDTAAVYSSTRQLSTFLVKKGYFDNTVTDSIEYNEKKQLARVHYFFDWEPPYFVRDIGFQIPDRPIARMVETRFKFKDLNKGKRFNVDALTKERERLTRLLRDNGYFLFTKDYIKFEVDSTLAGREVDLKLIIDSPLSPGQDSIAVPHKRYTIGRVFFQYDFPSAIPSDTLVNGGYHFVSPDSYPLKTKVLSQNVFLKPGSYYSQSEVELTYRRLTGLSVLSHVSITFDEYADVLDVFINMKPSKRQSFSIESQGTNSGGFLGIEGDLVYRHRNIFKGSETMEIRLNGGAQAQALITENTSASDDFDQENTRFNTLEFGPAVSLRFPKFLLPVSQEKFAKSANPSTIIQTSFNFQDRPDFTRNLLNLQFGYQWKESTTKLHQVNPLEVSVIRIDKSEEFQNRLDELNDQFLSQSFQDHFITSTSYTFTYNEQNRLRRRNLLYFNGHAELGGNILRGLYSLSNQEKDSLGSYQIFGISFSQYVKAQGDIRFYRVFDEKSRLATRFATGVGVPLENLGVLPFSESFFAGGANGMRAWRARTLGPGAYFEPLVTFDKIGDIFIEANVEYRFNLIDYLDGAFFIDAGNIWLLNENELRPKGDFEVDRFISEIGVGGGLGLRIDFNYFLIRFDLAAQLKDPSLNSGERWIFQSKDRYNEFIDDYNSSIEDGDIFLNPYRMRLNFNLGIGYPF